MHHQESDLLWRLGLISPEAYKINAGPRYEHHDFNRCKAYMHDHGINFNCRENKGTMVTSNYSEYAGNVGKH